MTIARFRIKRQIADVPGKQRHAKNGASEQKDFLFHLDNLLDFHSHIFSPSNPKINECHLAVIDSLRKGLAETLAR